MASIMKQNQDPDPGLLSGNAIGYGSKTNRFLRSQRRKALESGVPTGEKPDGFPRVDTTVKNAIDR